VHNSGGHGVAVIDDDADVLDSLKFLLEVAGHHVATYISAIDFLTSPDSDARCLIVDQHMPNMTGLELIAQLRAGKIPRRIMLITGSSSPAIRARAAELGVDLVIDKPPAENDLLNFITASGV